MRIRFVLAGFLALGFGIGATPAAEPDLSEYTTVDHAIAAKVARGGLSAGTVHGFLGIYVGRVESKGLTVLEVSAESPADRAGMRAGDILRQVAGAAVNDEADVAEAIHTKSAGDNLPLAVTRAGKPIELMAKLEPPSRPMASGRRGRSSECSWSRSTMAAACGLTKCTRTPPPSTPSSKSATLFSRSTASRFRPPTSSSRFCSRANRTIPLRSQWATATGRPKRRSGWRRSRGANNDRPRGGFNRGGGYWTKPIFRLGIVCVEYPDIKHNEKITPEAWEDAMFSQGTYTKSAVTGQQCFGSPARLLLEQSFGHCRSKARRSSMSKSARNGPTTRPAIARLC